MKPLWLAVAGMLSALSAAAQTASTQLPPLQQQWRQGGLPPAQQSPAQQSPAQQSQASPGSAGQAAPSMAPVTPTPPANAWLPRGAVKLQALDKVNAQGATLTIKVGQSAKFGSLTIAVKACMTRPTDQSADAAAFLDVTDSHPDSPGFDGWMLQAEPAVSMMQHPIYDLRVTGCG